MRNFFSVTFCLFFLLHLLPTAAFSASPNKIQLQYVCFPETLYVNSLNAVLDICLINQGAAGTLTPADYIEISIPTGTMNDDLVINTDISWSFLDGSWFCEILQPIEDSLRLKIYPLVDISVQSGEVICCQLSGVDINSSIGLTFLGVSQQISASRADKPINTQIGVFKTTTDRPVFIENDPKVGSSALNLIPKWDGSRLVDSISISEDATGNVGMSGNLNVTGMIYGNISGNAATANYAASADNATNATKAQDADTVDGKHAADLSGEVDTKIATHKADAGAHHTKTTSFSELTDQATDVQIPDNITIEHAATADSATNAGRAVLADTATKADHATAADNATNAQDADTVDGIHASTEAAANKLLALNADAKLPADITGNAATASNADTVDGKHASDLIVSESDPTVPANLKDGVSWNEMANIPADIADGDQVGITTELDPTVLASVKDGVAWSEVSSIPAGFADGVDNTGSGDNDWTISGNNMYSAVLGNVGIGTAGYAGAGVNPKLHVMSNKDQDAVILADVDFRFGNGAGEPVIALYDPEGENDAAIFVDNGNNNLQFALGNIDSREGRDSKTKMVITQQGKVGIGTTNPVIKLQVNGTSGLDAMIAAVSNVTGRGARIWIGVDNSGKLALCDTSGTTDGVQIFAAGASYLNGGNVGIGTTSPSYKLHVNGSAGKPGGGSWANSSDERLKKEIKPLTGALDKMIQLKGVNFEWINPEEHENQSGTQTGLVAQDVEKIFPEWVSEIDPTGKDKEQVAEGEKVKTLYFPHVFNAYLVEAIKELKGRDEAKQAQIEALRAQTEELKAQNDELRTRIEALESR